MINCSLHGTVCSNHCLHHLLQSDRSMFSMSLRPRGRGHCFDLPRFKYDLSIRNRSFSGVCMDKDKFKLARFLYTFRLYEVTVAVALFVYVVVFIVFLCVVS